MSKQKLHPVTEIINKKQQAKAKQSRIEALRWLSKTFPKAFDDTVSIHPLKIGIMQDILGHTALLNAPDLSKTKLREAVIRFTRRIDYLACLKAREMRIDLEGNPTTLVSEEEALKAAQKIKKQIEKNIKIAQQTTPAPTHNDTIDEPAYVAPKVVTATKVIVKHKIPKSFDPAAVARLKEKLGLSKQIPIEKQLQ